ncbi:TEA/ATTS domain family-domain-containing protein [Pyrenochaeta sp. MPI-SDFR-AT-0127]|nr:TEA/ATTS domain family-domain-containing protein [Pyrenochaeta sp. MPI-SDFR-AT-0127]
MEPQHQQSCVLTTEDPTLGNTSDEAAASQHRGVLQERSANWPHEYNTTTNSPQLKQSRSPSPTENAYQRRPAAPGSYFTGNVHAQHIGLAGFGVERPEKQIRLELEILYKMLDRSEKYQKYREKQPMLSPKEFMAREAAEKRAAEQRGTKDEKEKSVWPEFLEHAFWRALVKWPPMGRKKFMLEGQLRGRNELIQDSIYKDTGIRRCRKQVSSHLQVLKQHLRDQQSVLHYMATKENDKKRHRANESSHAYHVAHSRNRHHPQRTASASKYDYHASTPHFWPQYGVTQSNVPLGTSSAGAALVSPYAITDFAMLVVDDDQPMHYLTQLSSNGRNPDLNVSDTESWRRQYPEFDFLRSQTEEWTKTDRKLIVCDASIKVMTEAWPNASLEIIFNIHSQRNLSVFDSLECITRFYDSGAIAPDPQDLKEYRAPCEYRADPNGSSGSFQIPFGSRFWVNRMGKYQAMRHRNENGISRSLLRLTATQDVYGIKPGTGEAQCVMTILWRFSQTRSSAEVGSMTWRAVSFGNCHAAPVEQKWIKQEEYIGTNVEDITGGHEEVMESSAPDPIEASLYHQLPLDFQNPHTNHHAYGIQPSHSIHPPALSLDILASMAPDLENHSASAPTTASATDYSQQSLALSHSQDSVPTYSHDNDFDFNGGHITITGAFDSAINLAGYDSFASQGNGLDGLHALAGLEGDGFAGLGLTVNANNELVTPNWNHTTLISSLENAEEQYHPYLPHDNHAQATQGHDAYNPTSHAEDLVAHGLHDAHVNLNPGLWNLQSPFHEDTGSGAVGGVDCRKEQANGLGLGVLDLIGRDQRARGY